MDPLTYYQTEVTGYVVLNIHLSRQIVFVFKVLRDNAVTVAKCNNHLVFISSQLGIEVIRSKHADEFT